METCQSQACGVRLEYTSRDIDGATKENTNAYIKNISRMIMKESGLNRILLGPNTEFGFSVFWRIDSDKIHWI